MAEQLKEAGKTKLAEQARDDGSKCWEVMSGDSAWQVHHAEYAQIPESRWRSLWSKEFNKLTHWYQTKTTPRRPFEEDAKIEGVFNYIPAHEDIQPALAFSETLPPSSKFKVQFAIACRLADVQRQKDAMPIVRNLAQSQFKSKWASADGIELENLFRELSRVAHEEELRSISDRMQDSGPSRDYALSGIRAGMEEAQKKEIDTKPSTPSVQQEQANPKLAGDVAQLIEAHKYHEAWSFAKLRANSESEKWHIYDSIVEKLCHEGSGCQSKL